MWAAPGLSARQDNAIQRVAQFEIKRGLIYASAARPCSRRTSPRSPAARPSTSARYPTRGLRVADRRLLDAGTARAGLERSQNAYLTAANANLGTIWDKLTDKLKGTTVRGNNLVLHLRVGAQKLAEIGARAASAAPRSC